MLTGGALRPRERRRAARDKGEYGEQRHQHDKGGPAGDRGHVAVDEVVEDRVDDGKHAPDGVLVQVEEVNQESRPEQQAAEGHHERGQVKPCDKRALKRTYDGAGAKAHYHARPPGPVIGGCDKSGDDRPADGGDEAHGEVDLPEEEREQLGRAQKAEEGRLHQQVDDVAGSKEVGVADLEDHDDHEKPGQDRKGAALAATDPLPPGSYVLAE
jgi:hypothetical protein